MYARTVKGKSLRFAVSGKLWNRSLVMIDAETKSLWSHLLGECMEGELKGTVLESLPSDMVTWQAWRERYPATTVLNMSRTSQEYSREFYRDPNQFVLGFMVDGNPRHCTFAVLEANPVLQIADRREPLLVVFDASSTSARVYSRRMDGRELNFAAASGDQMKDRESGSIWDRSTGRAVSGTLAGKQLEARVGIVSYTRVWTSFHPDSQDAGRGEEE